MGWSAFGFLLFMLFTSNPFDRLLPAAADGRDLNPLLQDPGMVIHPPMLYMGYVGFSVAFAFAIAALIGGNLDADLGALDAAVDHRGLDLPHPRHRARQRLGLLRARLGRLVVLGSGRERLVHALAGRHRADPFAGRHREARQLQGWTVLLAILAFSLSLLGTFLVRSGVLTSVHAFATDPRARPLHPRLPGGRHRRLARAVRLARAEVGLGAPLRPALARDAAARQQRAAASSPAARCCSARCIRWSLDALGLGKISVGPPYFDTVFVPLLTPLVFLMGVGPLARWKETRAARPRLAPQVGGRVRRSSPRSLTMWLRGGIGIVGTVGLLMAFWIVASVATDLVERLRPVGGLRAGLRAPRPA